MPAIQTSYTTTMRQAFAGLKAGMTLEVIVSRFIEPAGGANFGVPVYRGTGDRQVTTVGSSSFVGITLLDPLAGAAALVPPTNLDQYQSGDLAAIMKMGTVWVLAGAAVTGGQIATVTTATNVLGNAAPGVGILAIGTWDTSAASGALALLRMTYAY